MQDIKFYTFDFNFLCAEEKAVSVFWDLRFNEVGTFEVHLTPDSKVLEYAKDNTFMVAVQGENQAIITTKDFKKDGLILYGRTPNYILDKRLVLPFEAENDAISLLNSKVSSLFGGEIEVADKEYEKTTTIKRKEISTLLRLVKECMADINGGHRVIFDTYEKKWKFECLLSEEKELLFSEDMKNAYNLSYTIDLLDYANAGRYKKELINCGNWDASENTPRLKNGLEENEGKIYRVANTGTRFGCEFVEGDYICCTSKNGLWEKSEHVSHYYPPLESIDSGLLRWESLIDGTSLDEATKNLNRKMKTDKLEGRIRNAEFGKDYFLGSIVRIQKRTGKTIVDSKKMIDSVKIWYENNERGEEPTFKEVKI